MMAALGAIALVLGISRRFRGHVLLGERENPGDRNPHVDGCADSNVLALVLRAGMFLTVLGLAIGLPVAFLTGEGSFVASLRVQAATQRHSSCPANYRRGMNDGWVGSPALRREATKEPSPVGMQQAGQWPAQAQSGTSRLEAPNARTLLVCAPIDMRIPISWVLSLTE